MELIQGEGKIYTGGSGMESILSGGLIDTGYAAVWIISEGTFLIRSTARF